MAVLLAWLHDAAQVVLAWLHATWLHEVAVATIVVYGILALSHLFSQQMYAWLDRRRRLAEERRVRNAHQRDRERLRTRTAGRVRAHQRKWYAWRLPGHEQRRAREQRQVDLRLKALSILLSIAVWVTVFQEDPELLRRCLHSLALQDYRGRFKVFVVDDASYFAQIDKYSQPQPERLGFWQRSVQVLRRREPVKYLWRKPEDYAERLAYYLQKRRDLEAVFRLYRHHPRIKVILSTENRGKREVQQRAWVHSWFWAGKLSKDGRRLRKRYDLYGSVDSDTIVDPDAFRLLAAHFVHKKVGAVTGYVDVRNASKNLLTRLIDLRYWSAFHVERAAQSYHRAVMCCSGPLALYRATAVDKVMGRYVTQRFLGRFCTFGDDRHLTNLILRDKYWVLMDPRAHCLTQVPTTMSQYRKQQVRWNKSFYREMLWTVRAIPSHSWYMTYDLLNQAVLPPLLVLSLFSTLILAIGGGGWPVIVFYLATVVGVGLARSLYGRIVRKDPWFLLFSLYGFVYVGILLPVRFYALATLARTHWGTRVA